MAVNQTQRQWDTGTQMMSAAVLPNQGQQMGMSWDMVNGGNPTRPGGGAQPPQQDWSPSVGAPNMNLQPGNNSGGWQAVLPGQPGSQFQQVGAPDWMGNTQDWWGNEKNQGAANSYLNAQVPLWQLQQNQAQYAKDFNEAQRQYNQQYNLNAQGQAWNQDFQTQQFNTQTGQWDRNFAETQNQNRFNNNLATQQFDQTKWRDQTQQGNWEQEFGQTQLRDQNAQNNWTQEFGANRADTAWNQNFQQGQADTQANQWNQQFGLNQQGQQFNQDYQNRSLAQQAQLAQQQNETALQSSRYAAFGRNRAPATGWASYG